jgi:hypothetical protein
VPARTHPLDFPGELGIVFWRVNGNSVSKCEALLDGNDFAEHRYGKKVAPKLVPL